MHAVVEIHQLWDWSDALSPVITKFGGFCTSKFGAGMHECFIRKDHEGIVRLWMRQSSKASSWVPEGPGLEVFKPDTTTIPMPPRIAAAKNDNDWQRPAVEGTIHAWCV